MSQSNKTTTTINAEQPREGPGNGRISGSVCTFPNAEQSKEGPGSQLGRIFGSAVGGEGVKRRHNSKSYQEKYSAGWPRSLEIRENRENGQNKFPAGKNQGISKIKKKSGNYQGILQ